MIRVLSLIKRIAVVIIILIVVSVIGIFVFERTAPQFGSAPTKPQLEKMKSSPNYKDGKFVNLIETKMDFTFRSLFTIMAEFATAKNTKPTKLLPSAFDYRNQTTIDSSVYVTWFGHSAILLEMEGKRLLLDPMLGSYASPVSFFGKRFGYQEAIQVDKLVDIDIIVISHDHYDHLDYSSIKALDSKTKHYLVPLGVGAHLKSWGVDSSKTTELDWGQSAEELDIQFTATPARHFSGRGIMNRDNTLWASWVIRGKEKNIYFGGDSGYGPHFKDIGDQFGPFDFTMLECGQYNEKWEAIHMMPEQTFQANQDLQGKRMMPIHWGAFDLSVHTWTEPIERLLKEAQSNRERVVTPVIGKRFSIDEPEMLTWWENI